MPARRAGAPARRPGAVPPWERAPGQHLHSESPEPPGSATEANGDFVVAWQSYGQDGSGDGVFAQLFSSAGAPLTGEFQVNTFTTLRQGYPSVATDADGDFVIAWWSPQDGSVYGVFARRFSSAGAPFELEQRLIPLHLVETALLLAALRRARRDPSAPPLPPIRSLRYIEPILHELHQRPLQPEYLAYLEHHLDRPTPIATRPPPHACGVDDDVADHKTR